MANYDSTLNEEFDELQTIIASLQAQKLSPQARVGLDTALELLADLEAKVASGEGPARLAALYSVSRAIGTSLNLDEVLQQVMDAVIRLTEAERGFLVLVESADGDLAVRVGRNLDQQTLDGQEMAFSRTVVRTVIDSREAVVTTDALDDPRFSGSESIVGFSLRSVMCAPMLSHQHVIGVIYVDNRARVGMFDRDDLEMLNAFAAQASSAIQNARLYTDIDRSLGERVRELENLAVAARQMDSQTTIEGVLNAACIWVLKGVSSGQAWSAVKNNDQIKIVAGTRAGQLLAPNDPLVSRVMQASTPHLFDAQPGQPARLAVPILSAQEPLGILVLETDQPLAAEALQYASRLANHAAIAINKVLLHQRVIAVEDEKANFVSQISKHLRTPFTAIQDLVLKLESDSGRPLNSRQKEIIHTIYENASQATRLVSDLSDIVQANSGYLSFDPVNFSLRQTALDVIQGMVDELSTRKQSIDYDLPEKMKPVNANPTRVVQVIKHLLRNASLYSPAESHISVSASQEGDIMRLTIADQGIGLSPEEQYKMYNLFYRADRPEVKQQPGWGIGLTLVKNLVTLMGGEINCYSERDKGSHFSFTLPLAQR